MKHKVEKKRMPMNLNDYQKKAMLTCMPTSENFSYMFLNLVGEVGEFASKVAKQIRKDNITLGGDIIRSMVRPNSINFTTNKNTEVVINELMLEAGDILWQLSGLCTVMGWNLDDVAQMNLDKLASRRDRNVIDGNGDNR